MRSKLDRQWTVTDEMPESRRGERVYLRDACPCGEVAHDLNAALVCGVLTDVRKSRKMDGEAVGHEISVSANTIYRWGRGVVRPTSLFRRELEEWLDRGAIPASTEPATAPNPGNQQ